MSKYIDADKLIALIDSKLEDLGMSGSVWVGRSVLLELKNDITSLQQEQPSLPSNLDEVAENYANTHYGEYVEVEYEFGDSIETIVDDKQFVCDAFKAGAEWMAERGDVIATRLVIDSEGKANLNFAIGDITDKNCKPKYYTGQDVIVQIRKK